MAYELRKRFRIEEKLAENLELRYLLDTNELTLDAVRIIDNNLNCTKFIAVRLNSNGGESILDSQYKQIKRCMRSIGLEPLAIGLLSEKLYLSFVKDI